jgi:hypothetical protein
MLYHTVLLTVLILLIGFITTFTLFIFNKEVISMAATAGRVSWDTVGERFWETGVEKGMLYPTIDTAHTGGFTNGVAWSGLTSVSESPSGADANEQYADNIKYLNLRSAEDFGFTIEAFYYPDEFAECDGTKVIGNGGIILRQQTRGMFGFAYVSRIGNDTEGDDYGNKLHLYYNATVNPSESQYQTVNDSPEPNTFSWEATTTPQEVGDITIGGNTVHYRPTACLVIDVSRFTGGWDNQRVKALTDILWGKDAVNGESATIPRLPSIADVIAILMDTTADAEILLYRHSDTMTTATEGKTIAVQRKFPANAEVAWTSSNTSVATIDSSTGVISPLTAGSTIITATITVDSVPYSDTCTVVVTSAS